MSLYRTYRPQSFADVVGQDHIVTTLENAAEQNKLANAYLFAGSRGTGKTSVARILAKILMIQGIEDETLQLQIVKGVEEGNIVDLLEIDAASNRGIDDIRELIEKIQFSPVVAAAKVYIIDEVHMLTKEAFNALLKTLEEPPTYAYFVLATTEINKIPATIQSRCQCFPFRRIREEDIIRRLQYIADQEKIKIERDALRAIAHHVEGGLRDAISLLDQMRSLEKIALEDVEQRIGSTGMQYIEEVFDALAAKDAETVMQAVRKVEEAGVPLDTFIRQMLGIVRQKLRTAVEEKQPTAHIVNVLDTLLKAVKDLRVSPVPGIVLESALIALCADAEGGNTTELFTVEKEEKEPKKKDTKATKESEDTEEAEATEKKADEEPTVDEAIVEAPDLSVEVLKAKWSDIVKETTPAAVKMSLKNGRVTAVRGSDKPSGSGREVDEKQVTISFSSAFHRDTVAKTDASIKIEKVMEKIFKKQIRLSCVLQEDLDQSDTKDEEAVNIAEAAAEIF